MRLSQTGQRMALLSPTTSFSPTAVNFLLGYGVVTLRYAILLLENPLISLTTARAENRTRRKIMVCADVTDIYARGYGDTPNSCDAFKVNSGDL